MCTKPIFSLEKLLSFFFRMVLVIRFLFPFFYNPADRIYSDMGRHINNGLHLFQPDFINGIDPKVFQLWMYLLQLFPQKDFHSFSALFSGLLCSSMAWFWYKALREITSRARALVISILLSLHLSLLAIYAFFMMETLLLTLVALATWMTLRSVRKQSLASFITMSICWIFAAFTKPTVFPIMILGMGYALYGQPRKMLALAITGVLFGLAVIPAGIQGIKSIHIFAPFGHMDLQRIARKSESIAYGFHVYDGRGFADYIWGPESFYVNVLSPIGTYHSDRATVPYVSDLDLTTGKQGWNAIIKRIEQNRTWQNVLNDYKENVIFLFFSHSWPDSLPDTEVDFWMRWNYHLRWLWFPCFMIVIFYGPFARLSPHKTWILLVAMTLTFMFLLQDISVVEGRYRKLLEPYLLVSISFFIEQIYSSTRKQHMRVWDFIKYFYLVPLSRALLYRKS